MNRPHVCQRQLHVVEAYDTPDGTIRICFDNEPVYLGPIEGARRSAGEVFLKRFVDPCLGPILERRRAQARAELLLEDTRQVEDSSIEEGGE